MKNYSVIESRCVFAVKSIVNSNKGYFRKYSTKLKNGQRSHKFYRVFNLTEVVFREAQDAVRSITTDYDVVLVESLGFRKTKSIAIRPKKERNKIT